MPPEVAHTKQGILEGFLPPRNARGLDSKQAGVDVPGSSRDCRRGSSSKRGRNSGGISGKLTVVTVRAGAD